MIRISRALAVLGVSLFALSLATDAAAQAADQKRSLKAMEMIYLEPGMVDAEAQAMRDILMLTGHVPSEDHKKKAEELGMKVRGVKEVRNRLNVRTPEVAAGSVACEDIMKKIEARIEGDEDLSQARRKMELGCEGSGDLKLSGTVQDYTVARQLIGDIRRISGVNTIDFKDLKY